jgi:phage/plasmid-like protein (TIGR03299 family)
MAHEIENVDGKYSFAYVGKPGWHGLGTKAQEGISAIDLGIAAGLDWTVSKKPILVDLGLDVETGEFKKSLIKGKRALIRDTDGKVLDIVSDNWKEVQNIDAFRFFDPFLQTGQVTMETAGSLRGGKAVFMLAKLTNKFDVLGGRDPHVSYLLFTNPHEAGYATSVRLVATRVVCNNTIQVALNEHARHVAKFHHVGEASYTPERAAIVLGAVPAVLDIYRQKSEILAKSKITAEKFISYIKSVYELPQGKDIAEAQQTSNQRVIDRLKECFDKQPGADIGAGTFYQAYHAVTFDTDHVVGRSAETRFASAQYGQGNTRKQRALNIALELAS